MLLVAKLSVVPVFAARFWVEERFKLAFNAFPLLPVFVFVPEAFVVPLVAVEPLAAWTLLVELPLPADVLPPLEELLLNEEPPTEEAVPPLGAVATFEVELNAAVELLAWELFDEAPNVAAAVLLLLAVRDPVFANAFVVPLE